MDIRSMMCFRLAYESGSIGKAAKRAFLTRQGLSGVLKNVETELGQTLFVRGAYGLEPTETARRMYPLVVDLLETYRSITDVCGSDPSSRETVGLAIAYGALLSLAVDELVGAFEEAHPAMVLDVDIVEPVLAAQCVAEGSKDFALVVGPFEPATVRSVSLCKVPLCAAVRPEVLGSGAASGIEGLRGVTWLGLDEAFPFDVALEAFSQEHGLALDMAYDWHDYHLILDQMRQGRGACIVPASCAERFRLEGIAVIPFDDPRLTWDICALSPCCRKLSRAAQIAFDWFASRVS